MELEEIVALSVKHNVSDLHLCNASAPRWRRQGKLEPAPFTSPDIGKILTDWLNAEQLAQWQACGQVDFALTPADGPRQRICAQSRSVAGAASAGGNLPSAGGSRRAGRLNGAAQ